MKPKYKRLKYILISIIFAVLGLWLILKNFNENIIFFFSPTELQHHSVGDKLIRVGGLVTSITKVPNTSITEFMITDNQTNLTIKYTGLLPNLFREDQGIVAKGKLKNGIFIAEELLAKHDENYMPQEIAQSLKKGKCSTCK